jgi:hypothetical protein
MSRAAKTGAAVAITLALCGLAGCRSGKWDGNYPATYVTDGEDLSLQWVTAQELDAQVAKDLDGEKYLAATVDPQRSALLTSVAVAGVGLAIDAVTEQLKESAKTYEQEWKASNTLLDFWGSISKQNAPVRGFVLRRMAEGFDKSRPAFELKVALVPVPHQPGLMALRPVSCKLHASRANSSSGEIMVKVEGELSSTTLVNQEAKVTSLGKFSIDLGSLPIPADAKGTERTFWKQATYWHIFPAPMPTGEKANPLAGGVLTTMIKVIETDTGKGRQVTETLGTFLTGQKEEIVKYVREQIDDTEK